MKFNGPIPGENYTSDTKNYPWHRPPEYTDLDEAIDGASRKLLSEEGSIGVTSMLHMGMDVATMVDAFLTSGIGAGKWTPDFAILMAGPVSHIICLMADADEIPYDLGLEDKVAKPTQSYLKAVKESQDKLKVVKDNLPKEIMSQLGDGGSLPTPEAESPQGFMSMAQSQMGEQV